MLAGKSGVRLERLTSRSPVSPPSLPDPSLTSASVSGGFWGLDCSFPFRVFDGLVRLGRRPRGRRPGARWGRRPASGHSCLVKKGRINASIVCCLCHGAVSYGITTHAPVPMFCAPMTPHAALKSKGHCLADFVTLLAELVTLMAGSR